MKKILAIILAVICVASLAACSVTKIDYNVERADRARHYDDVYQQHVDESGEAKIDGDTLTGAAVVRLYDFTGDGSYEVLVCYSSEKGGIVDRVAVYGSSNGFAQIMDEELTTKASASAQGNTIWVYTDSTGLSYIVKGEDLSKQADYYTFKKTDKDGNDLYKFAVDFSTQNGEELSGTYEKIDIVNNSDVDAVFAENQKVVDSLRAQRD